MDKEKISKSRFGLPPPQFPRSVDLAREARKGRRRLYPVTLAYSTASLAAVGAALTSGAHAAVVAGYYAAGVGIWTYVEYLAHRYVLHGVFPAGPGVLKAFLHRRFDHLHFEHHARPWDGDHINGTIGDTLPFVAALAAAAALAPFHGAPVLLAGLIQAYVAEEWIHHSIHFYPFKGRYFRYIRKHHLYHHSPRGEHVAYGLSNGIWDRVLGTRIPEAERRRLFAPQPGVRARAA